MCSSGWGPNFDNTKALMKKLGIDVPISGEKAPIAPFGSVFWFRVKALQPLFDRDWHHDDFPPEPLAPDGTISHAVERIYPFVAQGAGYYPAIVMSSVFAVQRGDTMQAYATGMIRPLARIMDCTTFWGASAPFPSLRQSGILALRSTDPIPTADAAAPATGCTTACRNLPTTR